MPTKTSRVILANHHTQPPMDPRLATRRLRIAFAEVVTRTPEPSAPWYDVTRSDPRAQLPCTKERTMLHAAIRQGCTTPERIIAYRITQLQDDLAQFNETPLLEELIYQHLVREQAESIDAVSRAHAMPTPAHRDAAIRETEEASLMGRVFCLLMRSGKSLLHVS
ncbi:MAG: hypothetical protein JWL61_4045 [Gemmatimonadetes bacterium]|nr:hypothetical protein [Gemmatimonadota bacterium]